MSFGGYHSGKVGTGVCSPDGAHFRPLRFTNGPFYLKIGLDIGRVFAKFLIFDEFFLWALPIGCQKVPMHPDSNGKKYWLVLKKALQETNGSDDRLQIFVFSGLVIG